MGLNMWFAETRTRDLWNSYTDADGEYYISNRMNRTAATGRIVLPLASIIAVTEWRNRLSLSYSLRGRSKRQGVGLPSMGPA